MYMYIPSASLPQFSLTLPSKPLTSLSSDCKASHPGFSRILPVSSVCEGEEGREKGRRGKGRKVVRGKKKWVDKRKSNAGDGKKRKREGGEWKKRR